MFIGRRPDGSIYGTWTVRQWAEQEELPDDHRDVVEHLRPKTPTTRTTAQKLAAVGITADELKAELAKS